ncbi:hypothetical protein SAMN02745671_01143 [Anaerovibrio lipolyticus DSM 3074]|uniref:Uncharacterized protein n=1 Tax=Anaerovibrio lipolyticus DSM 3074 TaxID=1120997 RepID=A0A1M6CJI2_9FIRM|nr:hypothetical protein [Anaerovibrio lipolyticus]SHI61185.1 hypothetical protein SAMN02745671_01143 [Anaerovibrio lipolyticus DSM 3074]
MTRNEALELIKEELEELKAKRRKPNNTPWDDGRIVGEISVYKAFEKIIKEMELS